MARGIYLWVGPGKVLPEAEARPILDAQRRSSRAHSVHQDTLKTPLMHPLTEEIVDSKSKFESITRRVNAERGTSYESIGNEKLSKMKRAPEDKLSKEKIHAAMEQAEAITKDPSQMRARREQWLEANDRARRQLGD